MSIVRCRTSNSLIAAANLRLDYAVGPPVTRTVAAPR